MTTRFNRFNHHCRFVLFCAFLTCFTLNVNADDLQDASKLAKQGQSAQALAKVDAYLANHPGSAEARLLKGTLLSEQGKTEEAIHIFTALTAEHPNLPEPYNNLAAIYAEQGQYEKAKSALESALRTNNSYATAYANLSEIYAKMASIAYDKALQLDKSNNNSNSNAKIHLAQLRDITPVAGKTVTGKTQVASADKSTLVTAKNDVLPAAAKAEVLVSKAEIAKPASITAQPTQPQPKVQPQPDAQSKPSSHEEILKVVNEWAKAWSARNAGKYLSMYAASFKTPGNINRSEWEKQRRDRIAKPQPITVTIINARVSLKDENTARVSFVQAYRSGSLKSTTRKTLEMTRASGNWLILEELSGV